MKSKESKLEYMKILAINGSPRINGNTHHAVETTINNILKHRPDTDTEFIQITDFEIHHCRGCRYCMTHVECIIKDDDLDILVEKMDKADLLLLGAPVYWWGPPGIFKDFIDRIHGFYPDNTRFKGKKVAVITVAAQSGFPSHEKIMSWLSHYGAEYVGWIRLFAREKGELQEKSKQLMKLESFSEKLANTFEKE